MKTKTLLVGMVLSGMSAVAAADNMPDICKSLVNLNVQMLAYNFSDGSFADKYAPKSVKLHRNFKAFPITSITSLGGCEDDNSKIPPAWCQVAGGSPEVFQVEVAAKQDDGTAQPFATVFATFNRGGCWVDQASIK